MRSLNHHYLETRHENHGSHSKPAQLQYHFQLDDKKLCNCSSQGWCKRIETASHIRKISFVGEKVAIKFEDAANPCESSKTARWVTVEGKKLGIIDARSPHLLPGCEAIACITSSSRLI